MLFAPINRKFTKELKYNSKSLQWEIKNFITNTITVISRQDAKLYYKGILV